MQVASSVVGLCDRYRLGDGPAGLMCNPSARDVLREARRDLLAPILDSLHGVISDVRCT